MTSFGTIPPEPPRLIDLSQCAPQFSAAVMAVLDRLFMQLLDPIVYEALRTAERQGWLFGFGRDYDDDRGIVTHVDDPRSGWHFFGLAVDIVSRAKGWDSPSFFDALEIAARAEGLTSGSEWRTKDRPHVQWGKCRTTPSAESTTLYTQGGLPAVWSAVGAASPEP